MIQRHDEFCPGDRYRYDFHLCSTANGWAQFDTGQDAHYFGNWLNPFLRMFFSYVEGDTTTIVCDTDEEFVDLVRDQIGWYREHGGFRGIDPGFNKELQQKLEELGLSEFTH